jgi:hypothetical protein
MASKGLRSDLNGAVLLGGYGANKSPHLQGKYLSLHPNGLSSSGMGERLTETNVGEGVLCDLCHDGVLGSSRRKL